MRTKLNSLPVFALVMSIMTMLPAFANAEISLGILHDFEDGTTQGWSPTGTNIASGGPDGTDDNFLEVASGGVGGLFAIRNTAVSGPVNPMVSGFSVDLKQDAGAPSLEMRLVLFGQGLQDRWTSANAFQISNDGQWRNYFFSLAEDDLIYVPTSSGTNSSYTDLIGNVNRVMLRHDPVGVSGGTAASGSLGMDNFATVAVPEPSFAGLLAVGLACIAQRRQRRISKSIAEV